MHEWQIMLSAVAVVFGVMATGAVARGLDWLTEEADQTLIRLTIRLLFPALVIQTIAGNEKLFSSGSLVLPPIVGFALPVLGWALTALVVRYFSAALGLHTAAEKCTFILAAGLFNYGYIPVPLVGQIFPNDTQTLSTLFLHNVGVETSLWTVGILVLSGQIRGKWLSGIFNPMVIAIAIAVVLNLTGWWKLRPAWVGDIIVMLGNAAFPMALLLSGAMIWDVWKDARFGSAGRSLLGACLLRLGILPAIFVLLAVVLPVDASLKRVLVVQAAMPSAIAPIVLSRHYGGDAPTAVRIVIATSLLGLGTIPLWLLVGLRVIG